MAYDPEIHHRRSIRLKNYDYSQEGYYFITVCTKDRQNYFLDKCVIEMIEKWWYILPDKFLNVEIDKFVVMPNHIHGIINIVTVGANQGVCPNVKQGEHAGLPLQKIIQWYKTMTTNEYIRNVKNLKWRPFDGKLWQRNYYEHIIRNRSELNRIRLYILNNPIKWKIDKNNPSRYDNI